MSKPRKFKCQLYCDMYDECKRTECDRTVLFQNGQIKMIEPSVRDYFRGKEKLREYRESRNTYINN